MARRAKLGLQSELFRSHLWRKYGPGSDGIFQGIPPLAPNSPTNQQAGHTMRAILTRFVRDESGATALEYGLIAGLIATVMVTATKTLGGKLTNSFVNVGNKM
jgi:pilus assembly protein Flp/PilA